MLVHLIGNQKKVCIIHKFIRIISKEQLYTLKIYHKDVSYNFK